MMCGIKNRLQFRCGTSIIQFFARVRYDAFDLAVDLLSSGPEVQHNSLPSMKVFCDVCAFWCHHVSLDNNLNRVK